MITLVLISHGQLASEFLRTAEMIAGPQDGVVGVGLAEGESPTAYRRRLREAIISLPSYDGMLVLGDLRGGTPCNVAVSLLRECFLGVDCAVLGGLNLAMLLEALAQRERATSAGALADLISHAGTADIRREG